MPKYFTLKDCEQYQYYSIPKELFAERFKELSVTAKFLYSLLLDRISLSRKNNWVNEQGHVYVIFTRQNAMDILNVSIATISKLFKELIEFDLIEEKRQGLTKANLIFVKKFLSKNEKVINQKSDSSSDQEIKGQDTENLNTINTNNINLKYINTEIDQSINQSSDNKNMYCERDKNHPVINDRLIDQIKEQVDYDYFVENMTDKLPIVDMIVDCISEIRSKPNIKINGYNQSQKALLPLVDYVDGSVIVGFFDKLEGFNYSNITNPIAYIRSMFINFMREESMLLATV